MPRVGAPAGRRLLPRADDRPRLTAEWLRRRYVAQRRSAQEIATETGWSSQYVRDRLRDHGIPLRPRGAAGAQRNAVIAEPVADVLAGPAGLGGDLLRAAALRDVPAPQPLRGESGSIIGTRQGPTACRCAHPGHRCSDPPTGCAVRWTGGASAQATSLG